MFTAERCRALSFSWDSQTDFTESNSTLSLEVSSVNILEILFCLKSAYSFTRVIMIRGWVVNASILSRDISWAVSGSLPTSPISGLQQECQGPSKMAHRWLLERKQKKPYLLQSHHIFLLYQWHCVALPAHLIWDPSKSFGKTGP